MNTVKKCRKCRTEMYQDEQDKVGEYTAGGKRCRAGRRLASQKGIPKYQTYIKTLLHDALERAAEEG